MRPARAQAGRARIEEHDANSVERDCVGMGLGWWRREQGIRDGVAKSRALGFDDFICRSWDGGLIGRGPWVVPRWAICGGYWTCVGFVLFFVSPFLFPLAWQSLRDFFIFFLSDEVFPFI